MSCGAVNLWFLRENLLLKSGEKNYLVQSMFKMVVDQHREGLLGIKSVYDHSLRTDVPLRCLHCVLQTSASVIYVYLLMMNSLQHDQWPWPEWVKNHTPLIWMSNCGALERVHASINISHPFVYALGLRVALVSILLVSGADFEWQSLHITFKQSLRPDLSQAALGIPQQQ